MNKQNELLDAAIRVFSKKGYHGSSISDITKEAGVSKALFYHYFQTKKDMLVTFARDRLEEFLPLADEMKEIDDPTQRLHFLVNFVLDELETKTEKLRFINGLYLTEDGVEAIQEAMDTFEEDFSKLFQEEIRLFKELGFENPELEATYMRSVLQGISLEYMLNPSDYPLEEMKQKLLRGQYAR